MGIIFYGFNGCIVFLLQARRRIYFNFCISNVNVDVDLVALSVRPKRSLHSCIPFVHACHLYALPLRYFCILVVQ